MGAEEDAMVLHWRRAFIRGETIMGTTYARSRKRRNNVVAYKDLQGHTQFAEAHSFHSLVEEGEGFLVAMVRRIQRVIDMPFVQPGNNITAIHLQDFNRDFAQVVLPE